MEMLDAPEYGDTMKEYGELIGKIEDCFERINILKREAGAVKERKLRELDEKEITGYDRIIGMLKVACSQIKDELSTYEKRALELQPRYV